MYAGRSGRNTLPPDYERAGSSDVDVAGPVILDRLVSVAKIYGQASDTGRAGAICLRARRFESAFECTISIDPDGSERLDFELRQGSWKRFAGTAKKIDGKYKLKSKVLWKSGSW
jgi:hypothetical protein